MCLFALCECSMQVVLCDWRADFRVGITLLYFAEVRNGSFCCCDSSDTTCHQQLSDLPACALSDNSCDVEVTVLLVGCQCPGLCCFQHLYLVNTHFLSISSSNFPILETPPDTVGLYLTGQFTVCVVYPYAVFHLQDRSWEGS